MVMENRNVIVIILCICLAGCASQSHRSKFESKAGSHMKRAAMLENSSSYHEAAQEYAIVAKHYASSSFYKTAVWKAAMLNIHPDSSKIDISEARFWLNVYLGTPLTVEEKESATLYVALLENINGLQTQLSSLVAERDKLIAVTQKQSDEIVTQTQQLGELEAELAQARDELEKLKEVDLQMQISKEKNKSSNSPELFQKTMIPKNDEDSTQQLSRDDALIQQDFYPYTIQVSSRKNKEAANREAMKSRNKGGSGFISHAYIPGKGDWYRVFIGFYRTFEEAEQAAFELRKKEYAQAFVVYMPFAIQIGVSFKDKELKILEADLRSKGYLSYSILDRSYNNRIRLLVGAFRTEKEAEIFIKALEKEGFKCKVVQR